MGYISDVKIESYKDLIVWQKSMDLVIEIYKIADKLPDKEIYGIASQIRRASVSIPSNIAEGSKRSTRANFKQFCTISIGSSAELETQLLIIKTLYPNIDVTITTEKVTEIQKMLRNLITSLKTIPEPRTSHSKLRTS